MSHATETAGVPLTSRFASLGSVKPTTEQGYEVMVRSPRLWSTHGPSTRAVVYVRTPELTEANAGTVCVFGSRVVVLSVNALSEEALRLAVQDSGTSLESNSYVALMGIRRWSRLEQQHLSSFSFMPVLPRTRRLT